MESSAQLAPQSCAVCQEIAIIACGECLQTWYCDKECQEIHRDMHKPRCEDNQYFLRVLRCALFNYNLFYEFRHRTWSLNEPFIVRTEQRGADFLVHMIKLPSGPPFEIFPGFPNSLAVTQSNLNVERIMARSACQDASAWMQQVMVHTFQSLDLEIYEVEVETTSTPIVLVADEDGKIYRRSPYHEFYKIVLNNGKIFAFDITSAQYGDTKEITIWQDYLVKRVERIRNVTPVALARVRRDVLAHAPGTLDWTATICRISLALCSNKLIGWLRQWEECNMPFAELLKFDMETFATKETDILGFMHGKLDEYIREGLKIDLLGEWDRRGEEDSEFKYLFEKWPEGANVDLRWFK